MFLLFVQGGQSLLFTIGKTEVEQKMIMNSTGRKWEFTFTTLVTFGGAFFASFPLFYSTSFGGAYWVWMLILLCFVLQAVSYEYQSKKGNLLGKKTYRIFLILNGVLGPLLLGTAVGTFFNGAEFIINKEQLSEVAMPVISTWANPLHGLEAAFNPWNLMLGLAVFFLSRVLALLYFINNINDNPLHTLPQPVAQGDDPLLALLLGFRDPLGVDGWLCCGSAVAGCFHAAVQIFHQPEANADRSCCVVDRCHRRVDGYQ